MTLLTAAAVLHSQRAQAIVAAKRMGKSWAEIAAAAGLTVSGVRKLAREWGYTK